MNLTELARRLARLDLATTANAALAAQAETIATAIREALSTKPGGPHDHPWERSGDLHDSIQTQADGPEAIVGSTSRIALWQEHGTADIPPRPTFAPIAAAEGEAVANAIAQAVAQALRSL